MSRSTVPIRLSDDERAEIERAAAEAGIPVTTWVRTVALAVARTPERKSLPVVLRALIGG